MGYWKDVESIARQWQVDRVFDPVMDAAERQRVRSIWHHALDRAKGWEPQG
jgi:glycerol kinase